MKLKNYNMINRIGDCIELKIVTSIYKMCKDKDSNKEYEKFFKELVSKRWFKIDSISSFGELITSKNKIAKTRSLIFDKYSSRDFVVKHSVNEIREAINGSTKKIGYK